MKLTSFDQNDFLLLERVAVVDDHLPHHGDVIVRATVRSTGFAGNTEAWIDRDTFQTFCKALIELEHTRRGQAQIQSISPKELELVISSVSSCGHMAISGIISQVTYTPDNQFVHSISFGFQFDPSQLIPAIQEIKAIVTS